MTGKPAFSVTAHLPLCFTINRNDSIMIAKDDNIDGAFMALAQNLQKLRTKRQLSQAQLADSIGVSHSRISEIEHGKANPRLSTLQEIAKFFNVSVASLVAEKRNLSKSA